MQSWPVFNIRYPDATKDAGSSNDVHHVFLISRPDTMPIITENMGFIIKNIIKIAIRLASGEINLIENSGNKNITIKIEIITGNFFTSQNLLIFRT